MSNCLGHFTELMGKYKGDGFLILGAGATVKEYKYQILDLIGRKSLVVIGINNMTHIYMPDIHLWTNNGRLIKYGSCIDSKSITIFGAGIIKENMPNVDYYTVHYSDRAFNDWYCNPQVKTSVWGSDIVGSFRQAGNLALYLAYLLGGRTIYYAGVDGYSKPFKGNHHCYGKGLTDSKDMKAEAKKDAVIYKCLRQIKKVVDFKIITPTIFSEFYDKDVL